MILNKSLGKYQITILEVLVILVFSLYPLLFNLPYRVNIFLSWEGAYRMSIGQMPYSDFGLPMGYMYWVIPAIFFKLFGPYMFTLVKAQVFINFLSLVSFRSIHKSLEVLPAIRLLSLLVFCFSFTFFNFWPWYNHSVIVFQFVGMMLLLLGMLRTKGAWSYFYVFVAGIFMTISFLTKQDSGALAIIFGGILLLYQSWLDKNIKLLACYTIAVIFSMAIFVGPFLDEGFGYWFNYGQAPHTSRLNPGRFFYKFFELSQWNKFYLLVIGILVLNASRNFKTFIEQPREVILALVALGVIVQSMIISVTSPLPYNHQTYFHGFAIAFILSHLKLSFKWDSIPNLAFAMILVSFWWSEGIWKYASRLLNIPTYTIERKVPGPVEKPWTLSEFESLGHIKLPPATIEGMQRLVDHAKTSGKELRVLNMTELTSLAHEMSFTPEIEQPLWYHLNVGIFAKEVDMLCDRISEEQYDVILFQDIPGLEDFYPYQAQDCAEEHYVKVDQFEAPRTRSEGYSTISVYYRP